MFIVIKRKVKVNGKEKSMVTGGMQSNDKGFIAKYLKNHSKEDIEIYKDAPNPENKK